MYNPLGYQIIGLLSQYNWSKVRLSSTSFNVLDHNKLDTFALGFWIPNEFVSNKSVQEPRYLSHICVKQARAADAIL